MSFNHVCDVFSPGIKPLIYKLGSLDCLHFSSLNISLTIVKMIGEGMDLLPLKTYIQDVCS